MPYRPGSSPIGSNQKQLSFFQDFPGSPTHVGAKSSTAAQNLGILDEEFETTVLTYAQGGAGPRTVCVDNKQLTFPNSVPTTRIAGLTTWGKVFRNIVELDAVKVVYNQIIAARPSPHMPRNQILAPVAGVTPGTNRIVEHLSVLQNLPALRGHGMLLLATQETVPPLRYSLS